MNEVSPTEGPDVNMHTWASEQEAQWHADAERLDLVMRATNEGLWDWDLRTDDVEFSPRWKDMLGYGTDELPNRLEAWEHRVHPDDLAGVKAAIDAYLSGTSPSYEIEHRLKHKDGSYRWICARGVAIRDSAGQATRFVGSHADITERKSAERALKRSRRRYQNLVNAIHGIVWEADASSLRFTFVSEQANRFLGYPVERWLEESGFWQDHLHPDDREWAVRFCVTATAEQRDHELEYRMIAADGSTMWFRDIITVIPEHGQPARLRGVMIDITEQKAVEHEVRRRDAVLEAVRFAAERFLTPTASWDDSVNSVLQRLGRAAGVSRVYIFENYTGTDGEVWATNTHEWVVADELSVIRLPQLKALSYRNIGLGRWIEVFRRGEMIYGHVRDLPLPERRELEAEGTLSIAMVPIFADGEWWGFIGFDECERVRTSSMMERDALKAAADTLGSAIGRRRSEEELQKSQRAMQTLLSNLPGMAYRCRNEPNWPMEFVSEGARELTGYGRSDLIGNRVVAYGDIIHPDDRRWVWSDVQAAVTAEQPFRITYRIRTAAGAEKWVMEQGRGLRNADGDLEALEGIISDVTDRVEARQELERSVERRTRELATLLSVSTSVASTLELEPLLGVILDQLRQVVDHAAAAIFALDGDDTLRLLDYRGPTDRSELEWTWPLSKAAHSLEVVRNREPIIIPDIHADTPLATAFREKAINDLGEVPAYIASWMGVPLLVRDQAIGVLAVDSSEPSAYTTRHAELALAFASQAAVAIENARLYEAAQGTAALQERQRLARELHDSVSQALFGIGLGARTARTLVEQDPDKAVAPIDYVLSLAEAGLAEMRALIFELRPEALEDEGLIAALKKQVAALQGRYGIEVEAMLPTTVEIPQPAQEAIYRIAQEALHNIVKHARASKVSVEVVSDSDTVSLTITDDGIGFDTNGLFPGHLGLTTMRERAEKLSGTFGLTSTPGEGSTIAVTIPISAR